MEIEYNFFHQFQNKKYIYLYIDFHLYLQNLKNFHLLFRIHEILFLLKKKEFQTFVYDQIKTLFMENKCYITIIKFDIF